MPSPTQLQRLVTTPGAVLIGLGSILGTGVFVSLAIAAGIAGPSVILAVALAALVATANGLSAAQLAASHPVSGGTYEYGYRYLNPWLGFTAGWLFLLAKSASAATAALGFAGYCLNSLGWQDRTGLIPLALLAVIGLTVTVLGGLKRSNRVNAAIVCLTLGSLGFFILTALPHLSRIGWENLTPFFPSDRPVPSLLHATALMFVAYTGYGRIATMGEEVKHPERTIPRSIIWALALTLCLYGAVAIAAVGTVGASTLGAAIGSAAPLETVMRQLNVPGGAIILALGAITAMLGVLLNLILGLSRVALAMGRRGDLPRSLARLNAAGTTPPIAVLSVGALVCLLVLIGNVRTTWSFSAFTVLVYYALTNLAALQLPKSAQHYPRWVAMLGLLSCLFLAIWVEPIIWAMGLGWIALGLLWKTLRRSP